MAGDQYLKDGYSLSALVIYTGTCVFSYKVFHYSEKEYDNHVSSAALIVN